jgi:sRNA-binding regulator protein Hfq
MRKQIVRETPSVESSAATSTAVLEAPSETNAVTSEEIRPSNATSEVPKSVPSKRKARVAPTPAPIRRAVASMPDNDGDNRQAELFYLQKQIQMQTQMVFILEDGERIQGVIEWYDRHSIKVRGKSRVLIYKAAIKYLYKAGEIGSAPHP